jgi:hypothetical protein
MESTSDDLSSHESPSIIFAQSKMSHDLFDGCWRIMGLDLLGKDSRL